MPSTRLTREQLMGQLSQAGRELSDAIVLFHAKAAEKAGLGPTDWKALGIIERDGPMTHRELVRHTGLKPASVTNMLDRLQAANWIERRRSDVDARSIVIVVKDERIVQFRDQIFRPLAERLAATYTRYPNSDLAVLARGLHDICQAQRAALADIEAL